MGQSCQHCLGEKPVAVNEDLRGSAGKRKKRSLFDPKSAIEQSEADGYMQSDLTKIKGMNRPDPNYRSQEIGIEDFQIIKVIGRGSFGKVYLVKKKDEAKCVYAMKSLKKDQVLRKGQTNNTRGKLVNQPIARQKIDNFFTYYNLLQLNE